MCYPGCIQQLELIAKNCRPRKRYSQAGWQLPYGDCAFHRAKSSIVTNLAARRPLCMCKSTLLLLQSAPLKCDLAQTLHRLPDCRASPSKPVNKMMCTYNYDVLAKRYAHYCIQNCLGQWTYSYRQTCIHTYLCTYIHTYIHTYRYRDFSHTMHSSSPQWMHACLAIIIQQLCGN